MLKLERVLNVSTLGDQARRLNIESEVRRLTSNIRFTGVNLLTSEAKQQLRDFASSDLMRVNFTAYSILVRSIQSPCRVTKGLPKFLFSLFAVQLEQNITSVNLEEMAAILNNTAVQVQPFEPNVSGSRTDCVSSSLSSLLCRRRHVTYYFIRPPILYGTMPSSCRGYKSLNWFRWKKRPSGCARLPPIWRNASVSINLACRMPLKC